MGIHRPLDPWELYEEWAQSVEKRTNGRVKFELTSLPELGLGGAETIRVIKTAVGDGRSVLLELVGYWRPEYLRKKFAQVRRAGREDVILAVSERLNLERAGVRREALPVQVVWFKDRVLPKAALAVLEGSGTPR
jgi:predicted nuclease of restriction endonuclease-like RecB superfamily